GINALAEFIEDSKAFTKTGEPRTKHAPPRFEDEPEPGEDRGFTRVGYSGTRGGGLGGR
ncbi:hypothetical protein BV22DRAFT_1018203, partial [Leucogyrophana mollusca]